jgi:hypothetical protein
MNRSTPPPTHRWSLASKSACGLVAALTLISFAAAQVGPPGGGGPGGGGGSGAGNDPDSGTKYFGAFTLTWTSSNSNHWEERYADGFVDQGDGGSSQTLLGIYGLITTANGFCKGKKTYTITWTGPGTPPKYAYIELGATASRTTSHGATGIIDLGLPLVPNLTTDPVYAPTVAVFQRGRKIKKVELNSGGSATFEVSGGVNNVSLATPLPDGALSASASAAWHSGAVLNLKGLGLSYDSYTRVRVVAGDHEQVYARPAGGDDFENQLAEIGASENLAFGVPVSRLGTFEQPAQEFTSSISKGSRDEIGYSDFPGKVVAINCYVPYSLIELVGMRKTPDTVTLKASQGESAAQIPGPFKGQLSVKVWATERVLGTYERHLETGKPVSWYGIAPIAVIDANVVLKRKLTNSTTYLIGGKVGLTRGGSVGVGLPNLVTLGVKADANVELNASWSHTNAEEIEWTFPAVDHTTWLFQYTETHRFNLDRDLASYGSTGYGNDFSDTVTDRFQPWGIVRYDRVNPVTTP